MTPGETPPQAPPQPEIPALEATLQDSALSDVGREDGSAGNKPDSLVSQARQALGERRLEAAAQLCHAALEIDETHALAWHVLAVVHEVRKDFPTALSCYQAALKLLPDDPRIVLNLSRLAMTMGMSEVAEKLIRKLLISDPENPEAINKLAIALSAQDRRTEAITLLRDFLERQNGHPKLLNNLGSLVADSGDLETANILFSEALRLSPDLVAAAYNLGDNLLVRGRTAEALRRIEAAVAAGPPPEDRPAMVFARGLANLALGDLEAGWRDYEARNDPNWPGHIRNLRDEPLWRPGESLQGRRLLVLGEQGLGDEVLFASLIPDVIEQVGPEGSVILAVEPRLVSLMARTFPQAQVTAHRAGDLGGHRVRIVPGLPKGECDHWTPIASLLQTLRPDVRAFAGRGGYLKADPGRVDHWRNVLAQAPPGLRIGLLWKSASQSRGRARSFAEFDAWAPVLRTRGATFVNLQYGDCAPEIRIAQERFGARIWTPPGIDLMQDLDEVTALASALDLTVAFANATFNLAAATGAPAWLIASKGAWTTLGTRAYPWYPQVRLYQPGAYADWAPVLARVAKDLKAVLGART